MYTFSTSLIGFKFTIIYDNKLETSRMKWDSFPDFSHLYFVCWKSSWLTQTSRVSTWCHDLKLWLCVKPDSPQWHSQEVVFLWRLKVTSLNPQVAKGLPAVIEFKEAVLASCDCNSFIIESLKSSASAFSVKNVRSRLFVMWNRHKQTSHRHLRSCGGCGISSIQLQLTDTSMTSLN